MKRQTKILITIFLSAALLLSFATLAFASEPIENGYGSEEALEPEAPLNEETDAKPGEAEDTDNSSGEAEALEGKNVFSALYEFALENADKIFSCLAFIGALVLSFAYKKGLFPFVEKALSSLTSAVKSLREEAEKSAAQNDAFTKALNEKLALSESALNSAENKLSELREKLSEAMEQSGRTEELRAVMLAEVEMIYNIFISSSLPQYQKDRVGEAYSKMKEMLKEKEG